ncbi:Cytochrome C biogenesis protein transmembrane region [uncultured archaeon]|nr:Cytochrome C biogenesis protein transmembrane region [uncultured archaeon]
MEHAESRGHGNAEIAKEKTGTDQTAANTPVCGFPVSKAERSTKDRIASAVGWIALFVGLFLILGNFPLFSSNAIDPKAGLAIIFVTGLLTSLHCIGMCSGFVISYAAKSKGVTPHLCYNASRMLSYVALGALLGLVGSVFTFNDQLRSALAMLAGLFMVVYGLSMFFPRLRRFVSLPGLDVDRHAGRNPVMFGLLNGLMPCGPLQAMLVYAAGTGSMIDGGLTMLAFGLGTIPLMFLMGTVISMASMKWTSRIVKFSAVLVMVLGAIMLGRGLLLNGISLPFVSTASAVPSAAQGQVSQAAGSADLQEINLTITRNGYAPGSFVVRKGIPVRWNIRMEGMTYCNKGIRAPSLGLSHTFQSEGETKTFEFTPTQAGTIYFTCWMGMMQGRIDVKDD